MTLAFGSPHGSRGQGGGFLLRGNQLKLATLGFGNYFTIRNLPPPPKPNSYGVIIFTQKPPAPITLGNGSVNFYDSVSMTPEPATLVLLATGLAGIGGVAARRRKQKRSDA